MMGKKRIFISDIHMGTERGIKAEYPYAWLNKNAKKSMNFPTICLIYIVHITYCDYIPCE